MHKSFPVQLTQNMLCPFCEINKFLIPFPTNHLPQLNPCCMMHI